MKTATNNLLRNIVTSPAYAVRNTRQGYLNIIDPQKKEADLVFPVS